MPYEFKVPDLGEGVDAVEVASVSVAVGDSINEGDTVLEVETDKAAVDIPAEFSGTVVALQVAAGDTIKVGQVILTYEPAAAAAGASPSPAPEPEPTPEPSLDAEVEAEPEAAGEADAPDEPIAAAADEAVRPTDRPAPAPERSVTRQPVFAAPSVRRFAREIGVNIDDVAGSGPSGRVSIDDVKEHARVQGTAASTRPKAGPLPDFGEFGPVTIQPMSKVRAITAERMALCWDTIPHVTLFTEADITDVEALRAEYKRAVEAQGGRLTLTVILVKLVVGALKQCPTLNASIDPARGEIILKNYYHIGVAADTERGLVVPVVRDADQKSLVELAVELAGIADRARRGKVAPAEMKGGTFTLSNLGTQRVGHFTPIINHPEVAILGVGRAEQKPVWQDGGFVPRLMMPLSLSIDHRLVDGADGAKFLTWIVRGLEQPLRLLLES